jgi:hypothetical protein
MSATPPDLEHPEQTHQAVAEASLRLLAGAVPRRLLEQLQRTVQQSTAEYPWQVVTQAILAEPVSPQQLVQQGLQAQRDWISRGGRETPGKPIGQRAKGFLARLLAQLLFLCLLVVVLYAGVLLVKHKLPALDLFAPLEWLYATFPQLRPK